MKDQFANYVVQKVLETCDDQQRELILSRIKVHLNALKKYTYGKHIVARVEKLVAAGGTYFSLKIFTRTCLSVHEHINVYVHVYQYTIFLSSLDFTISHEPSSRNHFVMGCLNCLQKGELRLSLHTLHRWHRKERRCLYS